MTTASDSGETESIRLVNGWSARVLTGARVGGGDLPEPEAWRGFLTQLVTAPEALPGYAMLKSSRGSEVFRATLTTGDRSIAVVGKQSRLHRLRRRLSAMTQGTREARNFRKGMSLLAAGFDTAQPLALLERRRPKREAWLITEFLANRIDLNGFIRGPFTQLGPHDRRRAKRELIHAIANMLSILDRHGLTHRDFKASNLLVNQQKGRHSGALVCVVDLDGIHRDRLLASRRRWRPVVRLVASMQRHSCATRSDFARFLQCYLASCGDSPGSWRSHFRRVAGAATAYLRR